MLRILRSLIVFAEELAVVDAVAAAVRRMVVFMALGSLVLLLVLAGAGCGAASLWIWADRNLGPVKAPLVVAGALIGLALLLLVAMSLSGRRASRARAAEGLAQAPGRLLTLAAQGFLAGLTARSNRAG